MSSTWVMVADGTRARLFALDTGVHSVAEIGDFINPGGRGTDDVGNTRQATETRADELDKSATPFASELNAVLQRGRAAHRFQDLILIAPPPFLEILDALLDRDVRACVAFALSKGMIEADTQAIFASLPSHALSAHRGH
jgi:protein required for attachment to host cells